MFFKKKSVTFDKAAKFNYELDTNETLKETLLKLSLSRNKMKREEYRNVPAAYNAVIFRLF